MTQAKHGYSEIDPTVKESKGTTKCGIFKLGTTSTTNVVLFVVLQASITNPSTFDFILSKQSLDYAKKLFFAFLLGFEVLFGGENKDFHYIKS